MPGRSVGKYQQQERYPERNGRDQEESATMFVVSHL